MQLARNAIMFALLYIKNKNIKTKTSTRIDSRDRTSCGVCV